MIRQRIRIRFRKEGDLRLISHRDLLRLFERLFRRADLKLSMTEGFHPKPRVSFPSALALGVDGLDEVMEFELSEERDLDELQQCLHQACPDGLVISQLQMMEQGVPKARVNKVTYLLPLDEHEIESVQSAIQGFMDSESHIIQREGRKKPLDIRPCVDKLAIENNQLTLRLVVDDAATARPKEILEVLGLSGFEQQGKYLTRSVVELKT